MRNVALKGLTRGKSVKPPISERAPPGPLIHLSRQFKAPRPNVLWLSDFTYVATWTGFVYVAFVIDAYARRIVGWRRFRTAHPRILPGPLEQRPPNPPTVPLARAPRHTDLGSAYGPLTQTH